MPSRVMEQPGGGQGAVVAAFRAEVLNLQRLGLPPHGVGPLRIKLRRGASPLNGVFHDGYSRLRALLVQR